MDTATSHVLHDEAPPPAVDYHNQYDLRLDHPPNYPPPSYEHATNSVTAPLLVSPPPDYGAIRAYPEPEESSIASSEMERTEGTLPEWAGQGLVILAFLFIIYGFFRTINFPDDPDDFP